MQLFRYNTTARRQTDGIGKTLSRSVYVLTRYNGYDTELGHAVSRVSYLRLFVCLCGITKKFSKYLGEILWVGGTRNKKHR